MATFGTESTRWYDPRNGQAVGEVMALSGKMRPATLKDARGKGWRRGVTTILKEAAAHGLEKWKRTQLVLACLTLPRNEGEALEQFIDRVEQDAAEEGRKAADRGKELHTAIQRYAQGQSFDGKYTLHVLAVDKALEPYGIKLSDGVAERSFCTLDYGGTPDWLDDRFVLDFKSKEQIDEKAVAYDMPHGVQLVAYDEGCPSKHDRRLLNVFVGVDDAQVRVHEWPAEERPRLSKMWAGLLMYSLSKDGFL